MLYQHSGKANAQTILAIASGSLLAAVAISFSTPAWSVPAQTQPQPKQGNAQNLLGPPKSVEQYELPKPLSVPSISFPQTTNSTAAGGPTDSMASPSKPPNQKTGTNVEDVLVFTPYPVIRPYEQPSSDRVNIFNVVSP